MDGAGRLAHVAQLSALLLIVIGPLPLVIMLDAQGRSRTATRSERLLGVAVAWTIIEIATAVALGLLGSLVLAPVLVVSGLVATVGILIRRRWIALPIDRPSRVHSSFTTSEHLVVLIAAVLGTTLLLRTLATTIVEVDSLVYHLPAVAQWY